MRILQILVLILGLVTIGNAQNGERATLSGTITDESGAVVPDILVEFKTENGEKYSVISDTEGNYQIKLPLGLFKALAEFKDSLTSKEKKVKIKNYKNKKLNIVLFCKYKDKNKCFIT